MSIEIEPSPSGGDGAGVGNDAAASATREDPWPQDDTLMESQVGTVDYAGVGRTFTAWFNSKLRLLPNASIRLGTKTAHVVELHPDGRLECEVEGEESKNEEQFVAFEGKYLDQLVRKIAAIGL